MNMTDGHESLWVPVSTRGGCKLLSHAINQRLISSGGALRGGGTLQPDLRVFCKSLHEKRSRRLLGGASHLEHVHQLTVRVCVRAMCVCVCVCVYVQRVLNSNPKALPAPLD
jgi:hypothetical protein